MFKKSILVILSLVMIAGCSFGGKGSQTTNLDQELKVLYYDEDSFYRQYGMLFSALNKDIKINVIPLSGIYNNSASDEPLDYDKAYYDLVEKEKPDLLFLGSVRFKELAEENKLANLDSYISKSKVDLEGFVPGIIDYVKDLGNGNLYGLATEFSSQVLFYNKDLFDKYNIPYPTNNMTWNDVFQTARQFPTEGEPKERLYGLKFGFSKDLYELGMQVAETEQLQIVNTVTKQLSINSEAWNNVFRMVTDVMDADVLFYDQDRYTMHESEDGAISYSMSVTDRYYSDPFIGGRLAMSLDGSYYINEIKQSNDNIKEEDRLLKNWDIAPAPISNQNPEVGAGMSVLNILAIPADASNMDTAWKFIEYITSDEYARVNKLGTISSSLPVRKDYIKGDGSYNHEALYALKPYDSQLYRKWDMLPNDFFDKFYTTGTEDLQKVVNKEAELEEVLAQLQVKGDQWLSSSKVQDKDNDNSSENQPEPIDEDANAGGADEESIN